MSSCFASSTSASVQARTCATPPGWVVASTSRSVWTESTASTSGRVARAAPRTACRSRPGANATDSTGTPRRLARAATWARDSSPETEQAGRTTRRHRRQPLQQQGRLADAGRPGEQHDGPRHEAAPEDAVQVGEPGRDPRRVDGARLQERGDDRRAPRRTRPSSAAAPRRARPRRRSRRTGRPTWQSAARRPDTRNRTLVFATGRTLAGPSDRPGWLIRATVSEGEG